MLEPTATATVLATLREHQPTSRTEVARRTDLSRSVVSTITRDLLDRGLIEEVGTERGPMGRPAIMLRVRADYAHLLGLSLDGTGVAGILTNLDGAVIAQADRATSERSPEPVLEAAAVLAMELVDEAKRQGYATPIGGAGIALSGLVDTTTGTCIQSTVMGWSDVAIGPMLASRLGLPVVAANDADAVAVGERLFGAAHGHDNFAVLSIGEGIGTGIIAGGRLYQGAHGAAGELGHCTIEVDGPACRCGKHGCLEAVASVPVILRRARECGLGVTDLTQLETLAESGNTAARAELERAGQAIGLALSHLVNLVSPALLIITGSGVQLGPVLQRAVLESHAKHVMPMLPSPPRMIFRQEGGAAWARGAAGFATEAFLERGGKMT